MATRKRYTREDRARVLGDVERLGVCGAAKQHRVPPSCVSRWRAEATTKVVARTAAGKGGRGSAKASPKVARAGRSW
ncbi:MAG: hypothetical protein JW751_11950 [Polyangiaceae bacterium]|nr:hypothetical protein [Polyangiaceae bacterium]